MSRCRVKRGAVIAYGTHQKAWISIRVNQIWEIKSVPDKYYPWYSLTRDCITIDVLEDDFKRLFEEVRDDGRERR